MIGVLTVVAIFALLGAVDLPGLYRQPNRRGEFIAATALLGIGMVLALLFVLGVTVPSVWQGIALFLKPVGTMLFKPLGA